MYIGIIEDVGINGYNISYKLDNIAYNEYIDAFKNKLKNTTYPQHVYIIIETDHDSLEQMPEIIRHELIHIYHVNQNEKIGIKAGNAYTYADTICDILDLPFPNNFILDDYQYNDENGL